MNAASAKVPEPNRLEDLGRATLQIVHDLKNQVNGLKLYATFLRKRFERENHSDQERETVAKLIAGLDRASRDMTALVRYARPIELRRRPHADLSEIVRTAVREAIQRVTGPLTNPPECTIESDKLTGEMDPQALVEAISALTERAIRGADPEQVLSLHIRRNDLENGSQALIEWRGTKPRANHEISLTGNGKDAVYTAIAEQIIAAHGGRIEYGDGTIRVSLPLSN